MVDFDVEMVGDSPNDIENRLSSMSSEVGGSTNNALVEVAEEVKSDLEDTSPVDTGEYRDSWYIKEVSEEEVWVLNEADHAKFVMLPNERMRGSPKADLPASGVLHNVKGIARSHKNALPSSLAERIQELISRLRSR